MSQEAGEGYRQLLVELHRDAALPAADKALFTAAAAATQGQWALVRSELERARAHGMDAVKMRGALPLVLINRGQSAFAGLAAAIDEMVGAPPPADRTDVGASVEEALAYYREHFGGEVPARQQLFAELAPAAFVGYFLIHRASLKDNVLAPRTAELLLCTVVGASYQPALLEIHMRSARREGATEAQLAEALLAAIPVAGFTAWASGAAAIIASREPGQQSQGA